MEPTLGVRFLLLLEVNMFGKLFRVTIRAEKRQDFIEFIDKDIEFAEKHEPGTLRFDLYQDPADENSFYVYEAYRNEDAFSYHKDNNSFYKRWDSEVVRGMMECPQHDFFESEAACSLGSSPQIQQAKK
jgi:quinol monooxygenase YgiN